MLISRAALIGRAVACSLKSKLAAGHNTQLVRNSHAAWNYRSASQYTPKIMIIGSHLVGGYMWWWILLHLVHEYEHITGEWPYPDVSKWTNAELGIPSGDELD